jgi:hypothetical protein
MTRGLSSVSEGDWLRAPLILPLPVKQSCASELEIGQ